MGVASNLACVQVGSTSVIRLSKTSIDEHMEERYQFTSMIRGYHEYQSTWTAQIGEDLTYARDVRNPHDPYAVSVKKGTTTVGHVPRMISCVCYTFLRRGGTIRCMITEQRHYSSDLPQGGLEIPCLLEFVRQAQNVAKVTKLLTAHQLTTDNHSLEDPQQPPSKSVTQVKTSNQPLDQPH